MTALLEINVLLPLAIPLTTNLGLLKMASSKIPPEPARKRKAKVEVRKGKMAAEHLLLPRAVNPTGGALEVGSLVVLVLLLRVLRGVEAATAA